MINITLTQEQAHRMLAVPMIEKFEKLLELESMLVQPGAPIMPEYVVIDPSAERVMPRRYQYPVTWNR